MNHRSFACVLWLASASAAQVPYSEPTPQVLSLAHREPRAWPFSNVLHDVSQDGTFWARGATWKASFGPAGFTYHPYFPGAQTGRALHFQLSSVRVGDVELPLRSDVAATRDGERVIFDRGAVREIYHLSLEEIEQTFVVDSELDGSVEVELKVITDLDQSPSTAGFEFACEFGTVSYSDAFVIRDSERLPIETTWTGTSIRLHVPRSERGAGPLLIDPILSTQAGTNFGVFHDPDVAYDATNDRYLVVWESDFSELDHDVYCEMFDGAGLPIPGSSAAIDMTTEFFTHPRVSSSNLSDRFLVVTSMLDPLHNRRHMIYGRQRNAFGNLDFHPHVLLSDPMIAGENHLPSVGADPGTPSGNGDYLVVWAGFQSGTQAGIYGRLVRPDGSPRSPLVLRIREEANRRFSNVEVSRSNGNGLVPHPGWYVAYTRSTSTGANIFGRVVDPVGTLSAEREVEATFDSRNPRVSSPLGMENGSTAYLVTYTRQNPVTTMGSIQRTTANNVPVSQWHNLTLNYGVGTGAMSVDSDGIRFVVAASYSASPLVKLHTFAYDSGRLSMQGSPQDLVLGSHSPRITSNRGSGGRGGEYGVAHMYPTGFFQQPILSRFGGWTPGPMFVVRSHACEGLLIQHQGTSALGSTVRFELSNLGASMPAFALGLPAFNPFPICPNCSIGVRLDLLFVVGVGIPTLSLEVPPSLDLIGVVFAVQGLSIGGVGTCAGSLRFSDTVEFTIR